MSSWEPEDDGFDDGLDDGGLDDDASDGDEHDEEEFLGFLAGDFAAGGDLLFDDLFGF